MKLPGLIRKWGTAQRDSEIKPIAAYVDSAQDKRLAAGELLSAGATDDLVSFIIEEIERLGGSIDRDL